MILMNSSASRIPTVLYSSLFADFSQRSCGLKLKAFRWLLLSMLISIPIVAQEAGQDSGKNSGQTEKISGSPADYTGIRYGPKNRRDPFLNPLRRGKNSNQDAGETVRRFPSPGIAGTYIAELLFEGTSFRGDRRLAIVRAADKRAYFLEEGARFFDGYLKKIQPDSIVLVREMELKPGKILTQDVIKRLRNP